jgi:hypothetical protein
VSNAIFPRLRGLTFDIKKRPNWGTIIQTAVSGREVRVSNRVSPIWEFELGFDELQDKTIPSIAAPAVSLTSVSGGAYAAATYFVQLTWVGSFGESLASGETSSGVGAGNLLKINAPASPPVGATGWNAYVGTWSGGEMLQNFSLATGLVVPIALGTAWTELTTSGLAAGPPPPQPYTDFDILNGFYLQRQGGFDAFLLFDPTDNLATAQQIGVGDGVNNTFLLTSSLGGFSQIQQNPIGPLNLTIAGVQQSSGFTIGSAGSQTAGIVMFGTPPTAGAAIAASYSYVYRVRFKDDSLEFNEFLFNLWELNSLLLTSVKL